jgi:hypothetical protein
MYVGIRYHIIREGTKVIFEIRKAQAKVRTCIIIIIILFNKHLERYDKNSYRKKPSWQ